MGRSLESPRNKQNDRRQDKSHCCGLDIDFASLFAKLLFESPVIDRLVARIEIARTARRKDHSGLLTSLKKSEPRHKKRQKDQGAPPPWRVQQQ